MEPILTTEPIFLKPLWREKPLVVMNSRSQTVYGLNPAFAKRDNEQTMIDL
jgi:hypothetical protein